VGSHRLRPLDPSRFRSWADRGGFPTEHYFWQSLSGLSSGTIVDHMNAYLTSLGYVGTPNDKFRQFLRDQTGLDSTIYDMAVVFFNNLFGGETNYILTEDGNYLVDEDGNKITLE